MKCICTIISFLKTRVSVQVEGLILNVFFFYAGKLNSRRIEPATFTYICFMPKQHIFVKSLMSRNQVDKRKLCEPASHVDIKK